MSRELKFRAWLKPTYHANEQMVSLEYSDNDREGYFFSGNKVYYVDYDYYAGQTISECNNAIIMQFTGMADKNGKWIYEGDVVKMGNDPEGKYPREIKYHRYGMWCKQINGEGFFPLTMCVDGGCDWEVIGNIYEHPTLLKQK